MKRLVVLVMAAIALSAAADYVPLPYPPELTTRQFRQRWELDYRAECDAYAARCVVVSDFFVGWETISPVLPPVHVVRAVITNTGDRIITLTSVQIALLDAGGLPLRTRTRNPANTVTGSCFFRPGEKAFVYEGLPPSEGVAPIGWIGAVRVSVPWIQLMPADFQLP